jgi:threonine/homoserine/homoserine lactone efflux protein
MNALITGFGVALLVSMPPGANTALCVASARGGMRRAAPIIAGAAATDATYAFLAGIGVLAANTFSGGLIHWAAAVFCLLAAALLWSERTESLSSQAAVGVAVFNPATAMLWLGLSTLVIAHPHGTPTHLALWVLGVAAGTLTWFSALAFLSAHLHQVLAPARSLMVQRTFALFLVALAALFVV